MERWWSGGTGQWRDGAWGGPPLQAGSLTVLRPQQSQPGHAVTGAGVGACPAWRHPGQLLWSKWGLRLLSLHAPGQVGRQGQVLVPARPGCWPWRRAPTTPELGSVSPHNWASSPRCASGRAWGVMVGLWSLRSAELQVGSVAQTARGHRLPADPGPGLAGGSGGSARTPGKGQTILEAGDYGVGASLRLGQDLGSPSTRNP